MLFLTGGDTSVVNTRIRDPPSTIWKERLPDQLVHSVCVRFDRQWDVTQTSTLVGMSTNQLVHSVHVVFDRWWDICGPYTCPKYTVQQTSTPVATATQKDGSFCLCCFWQAVRHLWSLHVSGIPRHMDLHPIRNAYLTGCFILSLLFLTGGESSHRPPLW